MMLKVPHICFSAAGALQPSYAPELNLIGVAQGGTPAVLAGTARFIVSLNPMSPLVAIALTKLAPQRMEPR